MAMGSGVWSRQQEMFVPTVRQPPISWRNSAGVRFPSSAPRLKKVQSSPCHSNFFLKRQMLFRVWFPIFFNLPNVPLFHLKCRQHSAESTAGVDAETELKVSDRARCVADNKHFAVEVSTWWRLV